MTYVIFFKRHVSMPEKTGPTILLLILGFALIYQIPFTASTYSSADNLVIRGLVSNPMNLSYGEVETLPLISEIVHLQCVYASNGTPYNWTGIPLFYLLSLAQVQPGAEEVVFHAEDGFSSSLTLDKAMHPTTILALKVNDTVLPYNDDYWSGGLPGGYPYKLVVPCKWGYKWVGWIDEIEIVDYDYKGFYESMGFSDEADIPNCTRLPQTTPAYTMFNATWRETYTVTVFTNTTLSDVDFNQTTKRIHITTSSNYNSESFVHVIIPKQLLATNFTVLADKIETQHSIIQGKTNSFLHFTLSQSVHHVEIIGMLLGDVTGPTSQTPDGKVNMRDIGAIARSFGTEDGDPDYVSNYDINSDNTIDMTDIDVAARQFGKVTP